MSAVRSQDDLGTRAVHSLEEALGSLGVRARPSNDQRADVVATVDGRTILIEVKSAAAVDAGRVRRLGRRGAAEGVVGVIVADTVTTEARADLTDAGWGWLDRRGHLRLRTDGVMIDADVPAAPVGARPSTPIAGRGAMSVAYWLLDNPGRAISPTKQVADIGFSPATISRSMGRLLEAGLVDEDGMASGPELFWALAEVWRPERTWLATVPEPRRDPVSGATDLRLTGAVAASALGAPMVATDDSTVELYAAGPVELSIAQRRWGAARPGVGPASLAVAPVGAVVGSRTAREVGGWTVAPLLAVALDLASDRGRGREVVLEWEAGRGIWR